MAGVRAHRAVPAAVVLPEAALLAVEPRAAQQDQWAAAPTVAAGQLVAVELQAVARLAVVPLAALADRPARKAAVRAVAEVAAAVQ